MFKNLLNLRPRHSGKPLKEIIYRRAIFKVLKQCAHGNAGALKNPRATDSISVLLYL
jgi:hypothetical protein